jgi:FkbM family methyltransferase
MSGADAKLSEFTIPGDVRVVVPADPTLLTPFVLDEQGDWFESEIHFVRRLLRPGMAVVDIGANYGFYTLTSARLVQAEGRVWSYEPGSLPRGCLARSISANRFDQVRLSEKALSDHVGSARLGIASNAELNSLNDQGVAGEIVPLTTLDEESKGWDRSIDFLKLDAEGEEIRILKQAEHFFAKHDPLVMFECRHATAVNHELIQAFQGLGMSLHRHLPGLNMLVPLETSDIEMPFLLNVFACRPSLAALLQEQNLLIAAPAQLPKPSADEAGRVVHEWIQRRPWTNTIWPAGRPAHDLPGNDINVCAIADAIAGDDPQRSAAERWALQRRSYAGFKRAIEIHPTMARFFSASRAAMELGDRFNSAGLLGHTGKALSSGQIDPSAHFREAFLPPHRRHDALAPGSASPAMLIQIMNDEPFIERSYFSSYFAPDKLYPLLQKISANPLCSTEMKRRLAAMEKANQFLVRNPR